MNTIIIPPARIVEISETLVAISRYLSGTNNFGQPRFEGVHVDVLSFISEPTQQTMATAIASIHFAREAMLSYRDTCKGSSSEYSAAHNVAHRYFILTRDLVTASKVHDLEKVEA
jgi:hypothetical protein